MNFVTSEPFTDVKRYPIAALSLSAATNSIQQILTATVDAAAIHFACASGDVTRVGRAYARLSKGGDSAVTGDTALAHATANEVSVFSEFEAFKADDRSIRVRIDELKASQIIPYAERLAERIEDLLEGYREDMEGRVFSVDSLGTLISFLQSVPELRYPAVTLTRSGDFYLSWKQGKHHVFSAQFLRSKQVRFAIFRPHPENVGQIEQYSGVTTAQSLHHVIRQFNVQEWAAA